MRATSKRYSRSHCNYGSSEGCNDEAWRWKGPYSWGNELGVEGWHAVLPAASAVANEVVVDLSPLNGQTPTAVRYMAGVASGIALPNGTGGFANQRM